MSQIGTPGQSTGRSGVAGPFVGAYLPLSAAWGTFTPGATTTNFRFIAPCDGRIVEVSQSTHSSAGGASRPTVMLTRAGNDVFSGAVTLVSGGSVTVTPTSSPSLVAAQRNVAKGDVLILAITTVVTEAVIGYQGTITLYTRDHVVALSAND